MYKRQNENSQLNGRPAAMWEEIRRIADGKKPVEEYSTSELEQILELIKLEKEFILSLLYDLKFDFAFTDHCISWLSSVIDERQKN